MNKRHIYVGSVFVFLCVLGVVVYFILKPVGEGAAEQGAILTGEQPPESAAQPTIVREQVTVRPPFNPRVADLNLAANPVERDLEALHEVLVVWRAAMPEPGKLRLGTNREFTEALTGKNPIRLGAIPPDHFAISERGELLDRWGTPYFFHPLSSTKTDVRSAGPDRRLFTEDDATYPIRFDPEAN